jgi:predicted alpha/beta hydrolase
MKGDTGTPACAAAGRSGGQAVNRRKELYIYPLEVVMGAFIALAMVGAGLARSLTLLRDWGRYKKMREI